MEDKVKIADSEFMWDNAIVGVLTEELIKLVLVHFHTNCFKLSWHPLDFNTTTK